MQHTSVVLTPTLSSVEGDIPVQAGLLAQSYGLSSSRIPPVTLWRPFQLFTAAGPRGIFTRFPILPVSGHLYSWLWKSV